MNSTGTSPEKNDGREAREKMLNRIKKKKLNTIIRKIQITTTLRYYFTATKMAKIIKTDHTKCCRRYEETGTLIYHESVK